MSESVVVKSLYCVSFMNSKCYARLPCQQLVMVMKVLKQHWVEAL